MPCSTRKAFTLGCSACKRKGIGEGCVKTFSERVILRNVVTKNLLLRVSIAIASYFCRTKTDPSPLAQDDVNVAHREPGKPNYCARLMN